MIAGRPIVFACLLYFCLLAGSLALQAAPWKPVEGVQMTRWAKDVDPEKPLPEYPRPQMVRPKWVNLNGLWDYAIGSKDQEAPTTYEGQILVPFPVESPLSGVGRKFSPDQSLFYRRTFSMPDKGSGERVLLHFGAVDWHSVVSVNGKKVGEHRGGYDPFTLDITGALTGTGSQELTLKVLDPSETGFQLAGKQTLTPSNKCYYTPVSGIWQTVWLEAVATAHITTVCAEANGMLDGFVVNVAADGIGPSEKVRLLLFDAGAPVSAATGLPGQPIRLSVKNPVLWSPGTPHLYDLEATLESGDQVRSYCALRKIEVMQDGEHRKRLALNGKIQFFFGPLDQGFWPDGIYTAPTDEALRFDIEAVKRMGFNMVRKHIKVEPARWYYWCDKLGLMVWQDIPSAKGMKGTEGRENFDRECKAIIESLRPFPSIIMWVLFNEAWGQGVYGLPQSRELADWLKGYDQTRLVNTASGWTDMGNGHVRDLHIYPEPDMPITDGVRASVVGEFGGLISNVPGHEWKPDKEQPYNNIAIREQYRKLMPLLRLCQGQGLAAAVYTQLTDVENERNGYFTYDRQVNKFDEKWLFTLHQEVFLPAPPVTTLAGGSLPWASTSRQPDNTWQNPGFDDSRWERLCGPIGANFRGSQTLTPWPTPAIWLRKIFTLTKQPEVGYLVVRSIHGSKIQVTLNGTVITAGEVRGLAQFPIGRNTALKTGENLLTVEATREEKNSQASFDVRLITVACETPGHVSASMPPAK